MPTPPAPARRNFVVLGLLSTFGPLSLDLYLPALPQLADGLRASTSAAQLSITACLVGLALGQLLAGPLSDWFGRRRPLVIGLVAYLLTSLACAFAPSIPVLVALRLGQGLAGAAGLVIARAIARDLYEGTALLIFFSRLTLISGLAPVVAPVLGGQLSKVMSWRGIFVVLAGFGLVLLLTGLLGMRETLPESRRTTGGLTSTLHGFALLLRDRLFVGAALASGLASASMFAYISGSTFVLQRIYGMSAQGFSLVFGVNSVGIMTFSQVGGLLARRWSALRVMALGLVINLVGAASLAATVLAHLGLAYVVGSLFIMVSAVGLVFPTATTLAMSDYPNRAGAASSLLGLSQFFAGAVAAPLVGIAGQQTAVPLGVVALSASAAASLVFAVLVVPAVRRRRLPPRPAVAPTRASRLSHEPIRIARAGAEVMSEHGTEMPTDPAAYWEGRYREKGQTWSGRPNAALVREVEGLTPGWALDLGCGEGGDAIWLARNGWQVRAVDIAASALTLAARTAEAAGVADRILWIEADLVTWRPSGPYDLVSSHFLHSPVDLPRDDILRRAASAVAPGGLFLVVGHGEFPPWADHPHEDLVLPTPDDVLAALALPSAAWEVVTKAMVDREATGPDGSTATLVDAVLSLRRR